MWLGLQALAHCIDQEIASNAKRFPPLEVAYSIAAYRKNAPTPGRPSLSPLEIAGSQLASLQLTFDEVVRRMTDTGEIYIEGDGSFVWCGREECSEKNRCTIWLGGHGKSAEVQATPGWVPNTLQITEPVETDPRTDSGTDLHSIIWRIEGNLYDGGSHLAYAQFVGAAPAKVWQKFLSLLVPDHQDNQTKPMVFQLEQLGIILDMHEVLNAAA